MPDRTCDVITCDRPAKSRGWCNTHYRRWQLTGDVREHDPVKVKRGHRRCEFAGCDHDVVAGGLCNMHYLRQRRNGSPGTAHRRRVQGLRLSCSVEMCDRQSKVRGMCQSHYLRLHQGNSDSETAIGFRQGKTCHIAGCDRRAHCRNLCERHYDAQWAAIHRAANPEAARAYQNQWGRLNPDKKRGAGQRRRARKRAVLVLAMTDGQLADKRAYWGNRCWMCGGPDEELDHVKPIAKGGPHILANLRPSCASCNRSKRDRWPLI